MDNSLTLNFPKADGSCVYSANNRKALIGAFKEGTYNKSLKNGFVDGYYGLANKKGYWTYVGLDKTGENSYKLWSTCDAPIQPNIEQDLKNLDDVTYKTTRVYNHGASSRKPLGEEAVRKEVLFANGDYQVDRFMNGKRVGGYQCNINEVGNSAANSERQLLTGIKGKIEKFAMNIAQDANGCERPVFRKISGKVINILRRMK